MDVFLPAAQLDKKNQNQQGGKQNYKLAILFHSVISFRLSLCLYRRENRGSVAGFVPELRLLSPILSISDSVSFDRRGKTTGNLLPKTAITGMLTADIFCDTIHISAHG